MSILELFFEFGLQLVGEALVELILHSGAEPFRKSPKPWLAAIGYPIVGFVSGGISKCLFPHHMVAGAVWRWVNLLLTPIAVGLCMSWLGSWHVRRGQQAFGIDSFLYGYLFALCFAYMRFILAK